MEIRACSFYVQSLVLGSMSWFFYFLIIAMFSFLKCMFKYNLLFSGVLPLLKSHYVCCIHEPICVLGLCRYIDKPIYTGFCSTIRFGYRSRGVSIQREATQTKNLKNSNLGILLLFLQFQPLFFTCTPVLEVSSCNFLTFLLMFCFLNDASLNCIKEY